jgi:cell division protein FtsI (penicillin-binding protein 3)
VTPGDGAGGRPEWSGRGPARRSSPPGPRGTHGPGSERRPGAGGGRPEAGRRRGTGRVRPPNGALGRTGNGQPRAGGDRDRPGAGRAPADGPRGRNGAGRAPTDGARGRTDNGSARADGARVRPDGARARADGARARPDGIRRRPAGPRARVAARQGRVPAREARAAARQARADRRRRARPRRPRSSLRRAGPGRRLSASLLSIVLVLGLFAGRLVQLQGLHWSQYRALAQQQMLPPEPMTIPVLRGSITSSDGTVLAMTEQTDTVYADPMLIKQAWRPRVAAALSGPLGLARPAILARLDDPSSPQYVVLKRNVPAVTAGRITALQEPGIAETTSYTRVYPNGDLAANLIGFTDDDAAGDLTGEAGLEQEYNALLAGRDGSEEVEMGPTQQPIPQTEDVLRQPVPAGSLRLTIQADIQWYAEQQCAAEVAATRAKNCSVVVMQPGTGRILALAQYPEYNPAYPSSEAATTDIPVQNVFQPGSTAKVITVAAALERGGQTPMSTYTVPDQIVVDRFAFHDGDYHPTQRYTIAGILADSLNDGMVQVVQHVSPQVQYQYFRAFGLGEYTGLGLPGESKGLLPVPGTADWYGDTRYTLSFGQGVAANAVQMASVYATIANGGVRVQPSVVAGTVNGNGTFAPAPAPRRIRVLQPKTARELMAILQQVPVVDADGGEPWGVIPGYSIASKTGTAEVAGPGCSLCEYGSSYIGIAPASDPQLVVAVNVQDPTRGGYFGDEVAGPVFYHVAKFALQTMRIPPDNAPRPRMRLVAP